MLTRANVTLGILAGGQARRLGGVDKALVQLNGDSLLSRTLAAFGTGYAGILVSYNSSDPRVGELGAQVVPDLRRGFPGPLAGLEALLHAADSEWLLTVPVDLRDIPADLAETLSRSIDRQGQGVALRDADGLQPLIALWPVRAGRSAATAALDAGERAVHAVIQAMQFQIHDISPWRLGNLNTPADFE
jgi:molybdopterin-guanine dinucleotide biosynthesis protein A